MKTLIRNVDIVTLDNQGTVTRGGAIAIDGAALAFVGEVPAAFVPDEVVDGKNHAAVPGFFNAHCHASMSLMRGYAEDLPLDRWFNERVWVAESALGPEEVRAGALLAACEMIRSGTVAFNDHYFYMDEVAAVVETSGLRASLTWCQFGLGAGKEVGADLEGALAFAERWNGKAEVVPRHDLVANLVHAAKRSDVSHVFVAGKLRYRDGTILTLDEEKIRAEAESAAFRMVSRDMKVLREYEA